MIVDVCLSPVLYPLHKRQEAIVVIVDIFRATTTITVAIENGAKSIKPVATIKEAEKFKSNGWLVGAERNIIKCDFADFGNSPFDYSTDKVLGKDIVLTTTNGTKAINCAKEAYKVITGAFINLQAVADYCIYNKRDVVVLCSGWQDKINLEDTLFGGALTDILLKKGYSLDGDAATIELSLWKDAKSDLRSYIYKSEHINRLKAKGLENDIPYCINLNCSAIVPVLNKKDNKLTI